MEKIAMEQVWEKYAQLDDKIKNLTAEKDELKVKILDDLVERGITSAACGLGKFTVSKLKSWTYTEAVEEKNEELKALKAKEESTGDATYEEKPSLRFTGLKL
jgi:hypothetical protein